MSYAVFLRPPAKASKQTKVAALRRPPRQKPPGDGEHGDSAVAKHYSPAGVCRHCHRTQDTHRRDLLPLSHTDPGRSFPVRCRPLSRPQRLPSPRLRPRAPASRSPCNPHPNPLCPASIPSPGPPSPGAGAHPGPPIPYPGPPSPGAEPPSPPAEGHVALSGGGGTSRRRAGRALGGKGSFFEGGVSLGFFFSLSGFRGLSLLPPRRRGPGVSVRADPPGSASEGSGSALLSVPLEHWDPTAS